MPPALNSFFEPAGVEFCTIFSKPFSRSSFNIITRETNSIKMFLRNTNNQKFDGAKLGLQGVMGQLHIRYALLTLK
jgi:hypothetical protein